MVYTLVRVGTVEGNLEHQLHRYDWRFEFGASAFNNETQHFLYTESPKPRLMITSDVRNNPGRTCDLILAVASDDAEFNYVSLNEFSRKSGIELRKSPKALRALDMGLFGMVFENVKRQGIGPFRALRDHVG